MTFTLRHVATVCIISKLSVAVAASWSVIGRLLVSVIVTECADLADTGVDVKHVGWYRLFLLVLVLRMRLVVLVRVLVILLVLVVLLLLMLLVMVVVLLLVLMHVGIVEREAEVLLLPRLAVFNHQLAADCVISCVCSLGLRRCCAAQCAVHVLRLTTNFSWL